MNSETGPLDYILVGGGLQSGLMALAIRHHQPHARLAIIEQGPQLAGNHTWSFHAGDIPAECADWIEPLVETRWPSYDILVGGRKRTINLGYRSISSRHFAAVIASKLETDHCQILTSTMAVELTHNSVTLRDGRKLNATAVFDNCGPIRTEHLSHAGGYQKFWGFEVELDSDWPFANPVVMDDRVDQGDGFRFFYTLPFDRRRVLLEDTRFSNSPSINREECLGNIKNYLQQLGCPGWRIIREETGILPMPTAGSLPGSGLPTLQGGYRGGWFHAATGYSFAMAVAVAEIVAKTPTHELGEALKRLGKAHSGRARFARFLNRLLFDLVKPQKRYQIFRRFYSVLGENRIARFYSHRFSFFDAFRIVVGMPPGGLRPINFLRSFVASRKYLEKKASVCVKGVPT